MGRQCRYRPQFKWKFDRAGRLRASNGKCLDISGANRHRGARVHMWSCHGGNNQKWRTDRFGRIISRLNNMCLDIAANNRQPGAYLHMWNCHRGANQKWFFSSGPGHAFVSRHNRRGVPRWVGKPPRGKIAIWGYVRNAVNGRGVGGASISLAGGRGRSQRGGKYFVLAPAGRKVARLSRGGFVAGPARFSARGRGARRPYYRQDLVMSPRLRGGQMRFVLTWGNHPRDLDSHLITPYRCHLAYFRRKCNRGRYKAKLDFDVTRGRGPETITVSKLYGGIYKYYIRQYSRDGNFRSGPGATVTIYTSRKTYVFRAGTHGKIRGKRWYVAKINGRTQQVTQWR